MCTEFPYIANHIYNKYKCIHHQDKHYPLPNPTTAYSSRLFIMNFKTEKNPTNPKQKNAKTSRLCICSLIKRYIPIKQKKKKARHCGLQLRQTALGLKKVRRLRALAALFNAFWESRYTCAHAERATREVIEKLMFKVFTHSRARSTRHRRQPRALCVYMYMDIHTAARMYLHTPGKLNKVFLCVYACVREYRWRFSVQEVCMSLRQINISLIFTVCLRFLGDFRDVVGSCMFGFAVRRRCISKFVNSFFRRWILRAAVWLYASLHSARQFEIPSVKSLFDC